MSAFELVYLGGAVVVAAIAMLYNTVIYWFEKRNANRQPRT